MPDFPAHASPAFAPLPAPRALGTRERNISDLKLSSRAEDGSDGVLSIPPPLVSPAFTPPRTPDTDGQRHDRHAPRSTPLTNDSPAPASFLDALPTVTCEVRARIPTTTGTEMWLHLYHNSADAKEHLAIVFGPNIRSKSLDERRPGESERERMIRGAYVGTLFPGRVSSRGLDGGEAMHEGNGVESEGVGRDPPLVRIHSECYTGETVWSARCDCGEQLDEAARLMSLPPGGSSTPRSTDGTTTPLGASPSSEGGGVIIYLRQEGRGIGLLSKLKAYNLQDLGHDTLEANLLLRHPGDARSYGLATAMLLDLGLGGERGIRLLTNNPEKVRAVEGPGREVRVRERVPMIPLAWRTGGREGVRGAEVERYIGTKIEKMAHMFSE